MTMWHVFLLICFAVQFLASISVSKNLGGMIFAVVFYGLMAFAVVQTA